MTFSLCLALLVHFFVTLTHFVSYKDFLQEIYKGVSREILIQMAGVLDNDINALAGEFGLTPRRIRDLLSELEAQ